jgi:hypothetical protein
MEIYIYYTYYSSTDKDLGSSLPVRLDVFLNLRFPGGTRKGFSISWVEDKPRRSSRKADLEGIILLFGAEVREK